MYAPSRASAAARVLAMRRLSARAVATDRSAVSAAHWEDHWPVEKLMAASSEHVMTTWGPGSGLRTAPLLTRSEGCYMYDVEGKKYLDWTSQAVCTNLGYSVPQTVIDAVTHQLKTLPMVYSGMGNTEVRIRLSTLLSDLLPGDLNGFLFPSGGSEANEVAIRIARRFTGRPKIINHYRSYHGGSANSLTATGDFRRLFTDGVGSAPPGFVKTMNPTDSHVFSYGATDAERTEKALAFLEEQLNCEGPHTVAAVMFESVIGSGGVHVAPPGYMEGVRALCDKHGILFIADEVMVGFGRTGKLWGFQNYDNFIPDIVTSAKGLTGALLPLSMVAVRDHIRDHFEKNALGWGATFHAHPVSMAAGYECVKFMLDKDLVSHAKNVIEPVMRAELERLVAKYDSVARYRCVGAFGCLDLLDPRSGKPIQSFDGSNCSKPEAVAAFRAALRANGLIGFVRPPLFHCAPALVISADELREGFQAADRALEVYDKSFR